VTVPDLRRHPSTGVEARREPVRAELAPASIDRAVEDEVDLKWYGTAFRRRWKLILGCAIIAAAIAGGIASAQRIRYEGMTTLLVVQPAKALPGSTPATPATFRAILENTSIATQIVEELRLNQPPHNLSPQSFLEHALIVEDVRATNIINVKVRLRDPAQAAEASRRVARKAIALTRQLTESEGAAVQEQLKQHLADAASRMNSAERDLLDYQQRAQIDLLKEDTKAMLGERGELLKLLISIESEKARLQAAETEFSKQQRTLAVPRAVGAEEALRRTDNTTEVLDPTNTFINPVYQSLDYQIAMSRTRLAALEQERRQLVDVKGIAGTELTKLSALYRGQIDLARLQTNFDLAKRVYSDLSVRFEESRTEAFGTSAQLQLVSDAILPDRPVSRRRVQWAALGFVTGLLAAGLAALWLESRTRATPRALGSS
jgi:capsular polysaccharide biosynthesis protein